MTNEIKHEGFTPGPWQVSGSSVVSVKTRVQLAEVHSPKGYDPKQREEQANGRLIADAPRLAQREVELMAENAALKKELLNYRLGFATQTEEREKSDDRLETSLSSNKDLLAALENLKLKANATDPFNEKGLQEKSYAELAKASLIADQAIARAKAVQS